MKALLLAGVGAALMAGPAAAACSVGVDAQLPVTMAGRSAMIDAQINGLPARFKVDTGAFFSLINPESLAKFGMKIYPLPPFIDIRGVGGDANVHMTVAKQMTLGGATGQDFEFLVGEHADAGDGLLGQNILSVVGDEEFDFANGVMRLTHPQSCGADDVMAYWDPDKSGLGVLDIERPTGRDDRIYGSATLNGVRIHVILDSGASSSVLTLAAAKRAGITPDGPGVTSAGTSSGIDRRIERSWVATFGSFDIGGEQIKSSSLRVSDIDLGDTDMLLGADFFLAHRIYVSKSQNRIYFTYNGGPVFDLGRPVAGATAAAPGAAPGANADAPTDAAGFARRGDAEFSRGQFEQAIADDSQAIQLEPDNVGFLLQRAAAHLGAGQRAVAMADLDKALQLKPNAALALFLRGEVKLRERDRADAITDLDAAAADADPDLALQVARIDATLSLFQQALTYEDQWIAGKPRTEDLAPALGERCRTRALWNQDLDAAAADCEAALKLRPGVPELLEDRGIVRLRTGRFDPAAADFSAALKLDPKRPWALYGRGLAEQAKGDQAAGDADIAASLAIAPSFGPRIRSLGFGAAPAAPTAAPAAPAS